MKTSLILIFLFTLATSTLNCSGQATTPQQGYKDWFLGDFRCGVYIPPSYNPTKKYPLVIYLHGKNDTLSRNIGWYHQPAALADPAIVLTPKCPGSETGEWGNSWSKGISPMMKKTFEMLELVKQQYNLDEDRYYLYGISMGAIGTINVIQHYPKMFAGGYAVCGWADPLAAPQLAGVPFWLFHGDQDDVVGVEGSRGIYKAVLARGGKQIRYTEFKGVKHNAWDYLPESEIIRWLLAQKRGAIHNPPPRVALLRGKQEGSNIQLAWDKPAASPTMPDQQVWYYKIYRNKQLIAEVDAETFYHTDKANLQASVEYQVTAVNYHFKESDPSEPLHFRTSKR